MNYKLFDKKKKELIAKQKHYRSNKNLNKSHKMKRIFKYFNNGQKYVGLWNSYTEKDFLNVANVIINLCNLDENSVLLDIGCGKSNITKHIQNIFPKLDIYISDREKTFIDYSLNYLNIKKNKSKIEKMPKYSFPKNMFDCIVIHGVFMYISYNEFKEYLPKVFNSLKKNGKIYFGGNNGGHYFSKKDCSKVLKSFKNKEITNYNYTNFQESKYKNILSTIFDSDNKNLGLGIDDLIIITKL